MENLREMKETLCEALKQKTSFEDVELVSEVLIDTMSEVFAGETVYIPSYKASKLHAKIRAKFNGKNHKELAKEFGYTFRTVQSILNNKKPQQVSL